MKQSSKKHEFGTAALYCRLSRDTRLLPRHMSWSCCADRSAGMLSGGRGQGSAGRAARWVTWCSRTSSVTEIKWTAFHKSDNITDVYYGGSEAQWKNVKIARDNGNLPNATVHYNSSGPAAPEAPSVPAAPTVGGFSDVTVNDYFAEPVKWAVEKEVTAGTSDSTFSPSQTCTQAHILTFLWRAKGEPAPTVDNPFSDVKAGDYYYNAALWAYEKGLISGGSFGADSPCTRAQTVTYQWKLAGSPDAPAASFTDVSVSADYAAAVAWAVEKGVTSGTSATTFSPDDTCTRGQIVTFLYRDLV